MENQNTREVFYELCIFLFFITQYVIQLIMITMLKVSFPAFSNFSANDRHIFRAMFNWIFTGEQRAVR